MNRRDSAERLHDSTKNGTPPSDPHRLVAYRRLDPSNSPRPFKEYRDLDQVPLPRDLVDSSLPATSVLSGEKGEASRVDSSLLATLLFLSAGVTRMVGPPGRRTYFRTAMSAGNLHPVEVYVVAGEMEGINPGVYHFSPLQVALTSLRDGDHRRRLDAEAAFAVVLTGIPWRTTWKYGERGWRHLYWDAGTMLANMLAVADAHGLENRTVLGFDDQEVMSLLGIDGIDEMPLAVVLLGSSEANGPPTPSALEPLSVDVAPVAPGPIRLPLLEEAQAGSSLSAGELGSWRGRGSEAMRRATVRVGFPDGGADPIEKVILQRGSTRRMLRDPVSRAHLEWPMAASTRAVGLDVDPDATLLDHFVNVHAVAGMDSGAYHQTGEGLELIARMGSLREKSAALCLGQPLGGDSAYTVFHCANLDPILDSLGSRGYRAAQLESGIVSGRLALDAFALGLGATGLTFFDDAVSRFFGTAAQPMLVTSVGVPAASPAPAGSPGSPAMLNR
ncbi:MAG: SagB family peptide dehydrogenase [Acidimicrobiia bacterium]